MGELSPWHWAIVIAVFVLLFGARRLPDAARSLGRSARILKAELKADSDGAPDTRSVPAPAAAPAPADVVTAAPTATDDAAPVTAPPTAGFAPDVPAAPTEQPTRAGA